MLDSILSNDQKLFEEYKRIVCESYFTNEYYHELLEAYQRLENEDSSWIIDIAKAVCKLTLFEDTVIQPCLKGLSYTAIGRHIYKRLKMCKQYAKEMATLQ